MPPLRRLLFAAVAIVALAAAASWIAQRGPRKFGEPVEVARIESATPAGQPPQVQPRRGAGTVGARAGSLGAVAAPGEFKSRASQSGDDVPHFGRAPRPSPVPQGGSISTDAQPEGEVVPAERAWGRSGVESVPPPTPGRDPRDSESPVESDAPPDPTSFAPGFAPDPPASSAEPPAPRSEQPTPRDESPAHETPSDSGESVTADGPLTPEQIDDIVKQKLHGLPDDQAVPLDPIVREDTGDKARTACDLTNCDI